MAVLKIFDRVFRHMDLMDRMMDAVGVTNSLKSLPGAAGVLRRSTVRCLRCANADSCKAFLDTNQTAQEAPGYCRNHDLFERIKRDIEAEQAA